MNFFTKIDIPASSWQIDYKSRFAFFGSCFADNISAQFASRKFKVLANPFGTVYNPLSIAKQIKAIADGKVFGEEDVFQDSRSGKCADDNTKGKCASNGNSTATWYSWDAHGSLSGKSSEECIEKLNMAATRTREFLQKADVVFITLGTAFVYFLKSLRENEDSSNDTAHEQVVSNCHRQDPNMFIRKMISVDHAAEALKSIVRDLQKIKRDGILRSAQDDKSEENSKSRGLHIVFTVSPLRHMSDGAHNNTLSKATLQLAINKVIQEIAEANQTRASRNTTVTNPGQSQQTPAFVEYFPSYEIVMDELRDYRFYDSDMIHLSKVAEDYIFERMAETYCSEKTRADIKQVEKFLKMANHRIQDADSPATAAFLQKLQAEAERLESQIAGLQLGRQF